MEEKKIKDALQRALERIKKKCPCPLGRDRDTKMTVARCEGIGCGPSHLLEEALKEEGII